MDRIKLTDLLTVIVLTFAASLSGCGWRVQEIAPNQLNNEISRGGIALPAGTTAIEGRWRKSLSHGSGLLLKLAMSPSAYREFRSDGRFKPVHSTRRATEDEVMATIPPVIRHSWEIKRGALQVLESGNADGTRFAAVVDKDGAATVYFSQFY